MDIENIYKILSMRFALQVMFVKQKFGFYWGHCFWGFVVTNLVFLKTWQYSNFFQNKNHTPFLCKTPNNNWILTIRLLFAGCTCWFFFPFEKKATNDASGSFVLYICTLYNFSYWHKKTIIGSSFWFPPYFFVPATPKKKHTETKSLHTKKIFFSNTRDTRVHEDITSIADLPGLAYNNVIISKETGPIKCFFFSDTHTQEK